MNPQEYSFEEMCGFCSLMAVNRSNTKKNDHSLVLVHSEQTVDSDFSSTVKDSVEYIDVEVRQNVIKKLKSPSNASEGR
jgi:hypothetical protein